MQPTSTLRSNRLRFCLENYTGANRRVPKRIWDDLEVLIRVICALIPKEGLESSLQSDGRSERYTPVFIEKVYFRMFDEFSKGHWVLCGDHVCVSYHTMRYLNQRIEQGNLTAKQNSLVGIFKLFVLRFMASEIRPVYEEFDNIIRNRLNRRLYEIEFISGYNCRFELLRECHPIICPELGSKFDELHTFIREKYTEICESLEESRQNLFDCDLYRAKLNVIFLLPREKRPQEVTAVITDLPNYVYVINQHQFMSDATRQYTTSWIMRELNRLINTLKQEEILTLVNDKTMSALQQTQGMLEEKLAYGKTKGKFNAAAIIFVILALVCVPLLVTCIKLFFIKPLVITFACMGVLAIIFSICMYSCACNRHISNQLSNNFDAIQDKLQVQDKDREEKYTDDYLISPNMPNE
jgi:hypothetical protein